MGDWNPLLPGLPSALSREAELVLVRRGVLPGRLRRNGDRWRLCLPRDHPVVRAAVEACAEDSSFVYPAMAALLGGHDGFATRKHPLQAAFLAAGS